MSKIRIFEWADPDIPAEWRARFDERRQWLGYAAFGYELLVSWVDMVQVELPDGDRLIAGNDEVVARPSAEGVRVPIPRRTHGRA